RKPPRVGGSHYYYRHELKGLDELLGIVRLRDKGLVESRRPKKESCLIEEG
ncbi:unnamed protein product, partial [Dovyalis caffra]